MTYIYLVENCYNDPKKIYVGKTKDLKNRKEKHLKKYGSNIKFTVIDHINSFDSKLWKPLETKWIKFYMNSDLELMNIRKEGGSGSSSWSEEQKCHRRGKGMGPNIKISKAKINHPGISKKILQYDLEGNFIREWCSMAEAGRVECNGLNQCIQDCIKGRQSQGYGFIWRLKISDNFPSHIEPYINNKGTKVRCIPIIQYDLEGNFIREWESAKQASRELKINRTDIGCCCNRKKNKALGYIWRFKHDPLI
jgi:hypothetical protein